MKKEQLQGRLNAQKQEFLNLLKKEGTYVGYSEEQGKNNKR